MKTKNYEPSKIHKTILKIYLQKKLTADERNDRVEVSTQNPPDEEETKQVEERRRWGTSEEHVPSMQGNRGGLTSLQQ